MARETLTAESLAKFVQQNGKAIVFVHPGDGEAFGLSAQRALIVAGVIEVRSHAWVEPGHVVLMAPCLMGPFSYGVT